jgi:hypothetical protein
MRANALRVAGAVLAISVGAGVLATGMATAPALAAAPLLGNDFSGVLYDVDPGTGRASNPRNTGIPGLAGIAFSPEGTLYGYGGPTNNEQQLFTVNPITGASAVVGPLGIFAGEGDLAFNPATGTLHGLQTFERELFTIDVSTGRATVVGAIAQVAGPASSDFGGMAFGPDGRLYLLDTIHPDRSDATRLLVVDPASAAIVSGHETGTQLGA